jgi:adenylylsulfate kinase
MTATNPVATNIVWHHSTVTRAARAHQRGHRSAILWFTGLSGAGKSTLANAVNSALFEQGLACYVLDGDNVRHGLCSDLGFSDGDREENIRRIGEVAKLFLDAGVVVLTAFVSPFRADRHRARALVEEGDFIEIHCAADLRASPAPMRSLNNLNCASTRVTRALTTVCRRCWPTCSRWG